jgi:hypothetical protein
MQAQEPHGGGRWKGGSGIVGARVIRRIRTTGGGDLVELLLSNQGI